MYKKFILITVLLFSFIVNAKDIVNFSWYDREDLSYDVYYIALLDLVLKKSEDKFGEYELNTTKLGETQEHIIRLISRDSGVNIFWTMTSTKREQQLQPIRIPLYKGLGGCRIFLIKENDQKIFDQISTQQQLKELTAGQGHDWPDSEILRENGYKVTTAKVHSSLPKMLAHKRFDYYPRALHEAYSEAKNYDQLTIERKFVLFYPTAFFFFVNKENDRLAARITYGLTQAINDGSFDVLFDSHPASEKIINKVFLKGRTIFKLNNPLLSNETKMVLSSPRYRSSCSVD